MRQTFRILVAITIFFFHTSFAAADVPITAAISSFDSTNINAFQLNGVAALNGSSIRLTPNVGDEAGSAFWIHKVSLANDRSFSAYFTFVITNPGAGGADGIVFTIQPNSNTAGSAGGGIGFEGIANSFGVEIDTYDNGVGAGDPNGNHIGIDLNGSVNSVATVNLGDISGFNGSSHFDDGGTYHMWIDYDGNTDTLEVRLAEGTDTRPVSAALTYSVDLATIFAEDVYVGFTAATGGADENHDITSFFFNNDFISEGIIPGTNTYDNLPFQVSLQGTPLTVPADGTTTVALSATVADVSDAGLPSQTIAFTTSDGTLTSDSSITNGSGVATNTITAPAFPGTATVRATADGGAYDEITVNFVETDSDGDGESDGNEFLSGSNPHDRGSMYSIQSHTLCSHWNSYLGNVENVYEEVGIGNMSALLSNTMYDIAGTALSSIGIFLQHNQEYDLLVHDQSGFSQSNYGTMCFTYPEDIPTAVHSRMIHYKARNGTSFADLQFDFAIPFEGTGGKTGEQETLFNTYHPSWDLAQSDYNVANWIIVSNLSDDAQGGTLTFFDAEGTELTSRHEDFAAKAERHFGAHELGSNKVGLVRWVPDDSDAKFSVHSVRYAFDNAQWDDSFLGAAALDGRYGDGEKLAVPVDAENSSAVLEIGNTLDSAVTATVTVYSAAGDQLQSRVVNLPAHGTQHLILDDVLNGAAGIATIDGSVAESIIAYALQYGRPGLTYMYATAAEEGGSNRLGGTFNSNLEQGCKLELVNSSASAVENTITLYQRDGDTLDAPSFTDTVTVPAHGLSTIDICSVVNADSYGTVVVENEADHAITGAMVRIGAPTAHSYRFTAPLRFFGLVG